MSASAIRSFATEYPDHKILMLTRGFYAPFFEDINNFDIFNVDLANMHRGIRGTWRLYKEIEELYDIEMIIDLNDKLYSRLLRKFFILFSGVRSFKIDKGRTEKKELTRSHNKIKKQLRSSISRYCDVFNAAGFDRVNVPNVLPKRQQREFPQTIKSLSLKKREKKNLPISDVSYLAIAPFAQHLGKRLPIEKIENVIRIIAHTMPHVHIFIFGGGNSEAAIASELEKRFDNVTSAIGVLSLKQEMDLMANMRVVVSMDSSSMHMASLLGVDVISIWGATHPYAGFMGLGQTTDNMVSNEELECRPCSIYGHKECRLKTDQYICLKSIKPESIINKIKPYFQ